MDVKQPQHGGWIEVITGSMFSGKSEELIRRLRRAQIARQKVQIFKPRVDSRFGDTHIVSHSDMRIGSDNVSSSADLLKDVELDTEVVGIDDAVAARIDKLEELVIFLDYSDDPVARNAGRRLDDTYHPARKGVEQARFADVGPANYRNHR